MSAKDGSVPAALGKTIFIRWSKSGPAVPHSARPGPASSTRTNDGDTRSTLLHLDLVEDHGQAGDVLVGCGHAG